MRIELGAPVWTSDGQEIGKIDKVIIDPATRQVRAAVVRKGRILTEDIEVPLAGLQRVDRDRGEYACLQVRFLWCVAYNR